MPRRRSKRNRGSKNINGNCCMPVLVNLLGIIYLIYYGITSILEGPPDDSQKFFGRTPVHRKLHELIKLVSRERQTESEIEWTYCIGALVMGIFTVFLAISIHCLYKKNEKDLYIKDTMFSIEALSKINVEAIAEAKIIISKTNE